MRLTPYELVFLFGEGSNLSDEPGFFQENGRFLQIIGLVGISFTLRNPHIALFVSSFHRQRRILHVNRFLHWHLCVKRGNNFVT